jgi:hypothetical protein
VRELAYRLSYNRPKDLNELGLFMLGWFVFNTGILSTLLTSGMKNGLAFLPHFVLGVTAANVFECWHYVRFKTRHERGFAKALDVIKQAEEEKDKDDAQPHSQQQRAVAPARAALDVELGGAQDNTRPAQEACPAPAGPASEGEAPPLEQQEAFFSKSTLERVLLQSWRPGQNSDNAWRFLWRFFPDAFAVCTGIIMSTLTPALDARDSGGPVQWFMQTALPLWFMTFGLVSMMQEGPDMVNGSRFFLENYLMRQLGYCSYPLYLFQLMVNQTWRGNLEHYNKTGEWKYFYTEDKSFQTPTTKGGKAQYDVSYMTLSIFLLIVFCYIIQYVVQDCLVGFLYSRAVKLLTKGRSLEAGSAM